MTTDRRDATAAAMDVIAARATVTLDARALDQLGSGTIDRLADLVAERLAERRAEGELPLLTVAEAAEVAGVHPETVRRAIRSGALAAAGYAGRRPRLRRPDVEQWLHASGDSVSGASFASSGSVMRARRGRNGQSRVFGDALASLATGGRR